MNGGTVVTRRAAFGAASSRRGGRLVILAWHNVLPTPFFYGGADAFERQVRLVQRLGNPVSLAWALDALRSGQPLPPRAVAITFDDGYRDNYEVALPILQRLGVPATFFLVPGYLSGTTRCWWETVAWAIGRSDATKLDVGERRFFVRDAVQRRRAADFICADLKRLTHAERERQIDGWIARLNPQGSETEVQRLFMDWEHARALAQKAAIGSHTSEHPILARESSSYQRSDLQGSRQLLAAEIGAAVDVLAYPNGAAGDYNDETIRAASEAGYMGAVTTIEGVNDRETPPYELRRFVMGPRWDAGMVRYLVRIFLAAARGG